MSHKFREISNVSIHFPTLIVVFLSNGWNIYDIICKNSFKKDFMVIETNTTQIVFEMQSFPLFTEKTKETHVNTHKAVLA